MIDYNIFSICQAAKFPDSLRSPKLNLAERQSQSIANRMVNSKNKLLSLILHHVTLIILATSGKLRKLSITFVQKRDLRYPENDLHILTLIETTRSHHQHETRRQRLRLRLFATQNPCHGFSFALQVLGSTLTPLSSLARTGPFTWHGRLQFQNRAVLTYSTIQAL